MTHCSSFYDYHVLLRILQTENIIFARLIFFRKCIC